MKGSRSKAQGAVSRPCRGVVGVDIFVTTLRWRSGARASRPPTLPTRPRWPMSTLRLPDAPNARFSYVIACAVRAQ